MNCAIKINAHRDLCIQASTHTVTCAIKLQRTLRPVHSSLNLHHELCYQVQRTQWPVHSSFNAHRDLCIQASMHTVTCAIKLQRTPWTVRSSFYVGRELNCDIKFQHAPRTALSSVNTIPHRSCKNHCRPVNQLQLSVLPSSPVSPSEMPALHWSW